MTDIATEIRTARLAAPMTQDQLARAACVTRKTVIRVERGHAVSAETLMALCSVLGLDASVLASLPVMEPDASVVEPDDLVAMSLRGDEDEGRRDAVSILAREAAVGVPGVSAMAVVDLPLWERLTVARLAPSGVLAGGAGIRETDGLWLPHQVCLMLALCLFAGVPCLTLYLFSADLRGLAWAAAVLSFAFGWMPSASTYMGGLACVFLVLLVIGAWTAGFFRFLEFEGKLGAALAAGRTAAEGVEILRGRVYVVGSDGLHILTLAGDAVETVHVPPEATTGYEILRHDGVASLTLHMATGREVPSGDSWTLETLGPGCATMVLPCLRAGPAFLDGLAGYRRIVRPRGVEVARQALGPAVGMQLPV